MREQRNLHVLAHGHRGEGRRDLEGPADAEAPDLPRLEAEDLAALQPDAAGVGGELAVEHVEAGRLARAVGADQREQLAARDAERDVAYGLHAAEGLRQMLDLQDCANWNRGHSRFPRSTSARNPPTIPCGNRRTIARMVTPSSARQ